MRFVFMFVDYLRRSLIWIGVGCLQVSSHLAWILGRYRSCFIALIFCSGCDPFQSPIDISLKSRSYFWGDWVEVEYDFKEPPAGHTPQVSIRLVGYLDDANSRGLGRPVFERQLAILINEALHPSITQTSLPRIGFSLPGSLSGVIEASGGSFDLSLAPSIQWAIESVDSKMGLRDVEKIDIR